MAPGRHLRVWTGHCVKICDRDSGHCYGGAEVSLLAIKALWCWAITSKHRGEVRTLEIMAGLVTWDGFGRLSLRPGCKAVYNQEVYSQGKSQVAACIFV